MGVHYTILSIFVNFLKFSIIKFNPLLYIVFSFCPPKSQLVWRLVRYSLSLQYHMTLLLLWLWVIFSFISMFIKGKLVEDSDFFLLIGIHFHLLKLMPGKAAHIVLFHRYLLISFLLESKNKWFWRKRGKWKIFFKPSPAFPSLR